MKSTKKNIKLSKLEKQFLNQFYNYALSLLVADDKKSLNELSELIKMQVERRRKGGKINE